MSPRPITAQLLVLYSTTAVLQVCTLYSGSASGMPSISMCTVYVVITVKRLREAASRKYGYLAGLCQARSAVHFGPSEAEAGRGPAHARQCRAAESGLPATRTV